MHIPDGFIDVPTAVTTGVLSALGLGYALRRVRKTLAASSVPLLGLSAAFVFAAQMLNFPVAGGTSGHLVGAVLVAVLLGPAAAVVVMSAVLILQCLLFADGGVTALGANVFNMAILAPGVGYATYRAIQRVFPGERGRLVGTAFGSWLSTVAAAVSCAGQLALSGIVPWRLVLPAMAGVHMLIGLGEALITTLVVAAVFRVRPDLFDGERERERAPRVRDVLVYGALVTVGLVVFVAPFASSWPDGLEKVAATLGFEHRAAEVVPLHAPLPDYAVPGVDSVALTTILAGLAGTVVAFFLSYLLARALTFRGGAHVPDAGK